MRTVNIHHAKTHLSRLVEEAADGEPFIIAKAGKPLVKVVPLDAPVPGRAGSVSAQLWGEPIHLRSSRGGTSKHACLRPEGLSLGQSGIAAKVDRAVFEGSGTILHCRVDCAPDTLLRVFHRAAPPAEGTPVKIAISDGWLQPAG